LQGPAGDRWQAPEEASSDVVLVKPEPKEDTPELASEPPAAAPSLDLEQSQNSSDRLASCQHRLSHCSPAFSASCLLCHFKLQAIATHAMPVLGVSPAFLEVKHAAHALLDRPVIPKRFS